MNKIWHNMLCFFSPLKRNKYNPYTFYCRRCGQEFNTIGYLGSSCNDHLEPMGKINDIKCYCMKQHQDLEE